MKSRSSNNRLEIDLYLSYPGATWNDRSQHTTRGCTCVGRNRSHAGPNRLLDSNRRRSVAKVHHDRTAVSGEPGAIRRTTRGDRFSGFPGLSVGLAWRMGLHATQLSCQGGERTPYKELTLSQVPYEHGLLVDGSLLVCVFCARDVQELRAAVQACRMLQG